MQQFNCVSGSSFSDVCLNTYGSLDNYIKLLNDNNLEPEDIPGSGQPVQWDNTLVENQPVITTLATNNTIYATLLGYGNPEQVNPTSSMYSQTLSTTYTASVSGETIISLPQLQGTTLVTVTKEIKPLFASEFQFNAVTGTVSLLGTSLDAGESLFILYNKTITI